MRISRILAMPVLAGALLTTTAAPTAADETWREPEVAWVNQNVVATRDGEQAFLLVKYRCWGEGTHMWGSAKQGPALDPESGQTGSDDAISWRETPEGPKPTCNGRWQVERVVLQNTEDTQNHAPLTRGAAWVQFVIFAIDPETFNEETGEGFGRGAESGWKTVRGRA